MAYRKKTLRRMSPTARKVARLAGELGFDSQALAHAKEQKYQGKPGG